jgi:hypothetical protein
LGVLDIPPLSSTPGQGHLTLTFLSLSLLFSLYFFDLAPSLLHTFSTYRPPSTRHCRDLTEGRHPPCQGPLHCWTARELDEGPRSWSSPKLEAPPSPPCYSPQVRAPPLDGGRRCVKSTLYMQVADHKGILHPLQSKKNELIFSKMIISWTKVFNFLD